MPFHYVWLFWSSAFLVPWGVLFVLNDSKRGQMWRVSLATACFGLTEPIFVPHYWNPPSLFELAQRTRFDLESLIFSFAIGGIGVVLYDAITKRRLMPMESAQRLARRHRWHRLALCGPLVLFIPLYLLPWNPIYAALVSLAVGAVASVGCRPDLAAKTTVSGFLFLLLYWVFMLALLWFAPGYIASVWNLPALSGVLIGGIPLEELLFGFAFGVYWASVYEHLTWHMSSRIPTLMQSHPSHDIDVAGDSLRSRATSALRRTAGEVPKRPDRFWYRSALRDDAPSFLGGQA